MHHGQAALLGVLRSVMAQSGLRGPLASAQFAALRPGRHAGVGPLPREDDYGR
ncbi:hypothetical protein [Streptomyces sp. MMBL 11-3]|uniref:hypothetical protein n=1 Tax=Streptomyces sp. MMBL 11-3 TaxID=3382639 RepID=UPI0039B446CD